MVNRDALNVQVDELRKEREIMDKFDKLDVSKSYPTPSPPIWASCGRGASRLRRGRATHFEARAALCF